MQCIIALLLFLTFGSPILAHIEITYPPPLRSKYNPNTSEGKIDYSMTSPLDQSGSNFPCKGYQTDLSTPGGASVATWAAGSTHNYSVSSGGALHGGGSCQASLSYDNGTSFKVIHSYIGSCPISFGESFDFTVPSDAATGPALFAWTWYNMIGNRELYMNCASVTIAAASGARSAPSVAYKDRPDMWVANMNNGCLSVETKEVIFPDPGPASDVTTKNTVKADTDSFTGTCAAVKGIGGADAAGGGSASGAAPVSSAASASAPASSAPATSASAATTLVTSAVPTSAPASASATVIASSVSAPAGTAASSASTPSSTSSPSGGGNLTTTADGKCTGPNTCNGSIHGPCCSKWGWCGSTTDYCGAGCNAGFGSCGGGSGNSTGPATTAVLRRAWN